MYVVASTRRNYHDIFSLNISPLLFPTLEAAKRCVANDWSWWDDFDAIDELPDYTKLPFEEEEGGLVWSLIDDEHTDDYTVWKIQRVS
ncbi:MAG: hypothetical protein PHU06_06020 [Gallionella sp.]|nr:hypothetical protein [Gallionella sp.]MDD4958404.1 hypothetical protein [Gallionella sp.]